MHEYLDKMDTHIPEEGTRLAKKMALMGLCSRREADEYILKGWVKVNGEVIRQKGFRVSDTDVITLNPLAQQQQSKKVTILLHKPVGFVSGQPEKNYRAAVELITAHNHWSGDKSKIKFNPQHAFGLAPAGRLDIDSVGLLILTQDGVVAKQIIGENSIINKEYIVKVKGTIIKNGLQLLNHGLSLDDQPLLPATVTYEGENTYRFILNQGKKRQIRRMCELVGLKVVHLKRIRIGKVRLGALPRGQWRYLAPYEKF